MNDFKERLKDFLVVAIPVILFALVLIGIMYIKGCVWDSDIPTWLKFLIL